MRANGGWFVRGGYSTAASGNLPGAVPSGYHTLAIEWDPTAEMAYAYFDTTILTPAGVSLPGLPAMTEAGFGQQGIANGTVNLFTVATVPEPVTLALVALGMLFLRRRHVRI